MQVVAVGAGGALGALCRFAATSALAPIMGAAAAVGSINVAGCFLAGIVWSTPTGGVLTPLVRVGLTVGFLGGFTTWSSFAVDVVALWRAGSVGPAVALAGTTVLACLGAAAAGAWVGTVGRS